MSEATGTGDKSAYYGLASLFIDVNNDGKVEPSGGGRFDAELPVSQQWQGAGLNDASFASGYALERERARDGVYGGSRSGDLWHNGRIDLYNTTFSDDYKPL